MSSVLFYRVKVDVVGEDRISCSAHLRKIADLIMRGDAPGWSTSDVNGSVSADRMPIQRQRRKYSRAICSVCEQEHALIDGVVWNHIVMQKQCPGAKKPP